MITINAIPTLSRENLNVKTGILILDATWEKTLQAMDFTCQLDKQLKQNLGDTT